VILLSTKLSGNSMEKEDFMLINKVENVITIYAPHSPSYVDKYSEHR
jgi:hypothetical protein